MVGKVIHVHEAVSFEVTLYDERGDPLDLTDVPCVITFRPPNGPCWVATAQALNPPTGVVSYTTLLTDLDRPGLWRFQVRAELPARSWCSEIAEFQVHPA